MASNRSSTSGFGRFLAQTGIALAAAIVLVIVLLRARPDEQTPPTPGIRAVAGEFRTVPELPDAQRRAIRHELAQKLVKLYERAFLASVSAPTPGPTPGEPAERIQTLFTAAARKALSKDPAVFDYVDGFEIASGRIAFSGVATLDGAKGAEAFLHVDFEAIAAPEGRTEPQVRVHQFGTMLLVRTPPWRVDGFDLKLTTKETEPTPTPSRT